MNLMNVVAVKIQQPPPLAGFYVSTLAICQDIQARCREGLPQEIALVLGKELARLRLKLRFGPILAAR
jgi:hypothetical protein